MKVTVQLLLATLCVAAAYAGNKAQSRQAATKGLCSKSSDCKPTECCVKKNNKSICKPLSKVSNKCNATAINDQYSKYCPCETGLTCEVKKFSPRGASICKAPTIKKKTCTSASNCSISECCVKQGRKPATCMKLGAVNDVCRVPRRHIMADKELPMVCSCEEGLVCKTGDNNKLGKCALL